MADYFNGKHYADSTAYHAMKRIEKKEKKKKKPCPKQDKPAMLKGLKQSNKSV